MNEKLNIQDLIEILAEKHGMDKKDAEGFVKEFFQLIEESLESDKYVKIKGLGTFKLIDVDKRESVNINTGERFEIQGHTKVSFTPEPALKDIINKPFGHFETVVLNEETVLDDTPLEGGVEEEEEKEEEVPSAEQIIEVPIGTPAEETAEEIIEIKEGIVESVENTDEVADNHAESVTLVEQSVEEEKATQEETVQDELPAMPTNDAIEPSASVPDKSDGSTMKFFIGIVIFVVLLCVGAVIFMYYPDLFDGMRSAPPTENIADEKAEKPVTPVALTDSIIKKDTTLIAKEDTVAESKKTETKKPAATPIEPDSLNYKIVGTKTTYTILEGETLTRVALRFYGTKALWPYIVKHNPDVIKNPDHVPYGTVVKIPELVKK